VRRGTFEEGGRTKEEGDVICGVWSEECGVRIPLRFRNHDVTMTDGIKPLASPKVLSFGKAKKNKFSLCISLTYYYLCSALLLIKGIKTVKR
jgi:hypothetical protein